MSSAVRSVAVVGRDAAAWIAAASLQRALQPAGITVQVVELPTRLSAVDVYAALPSLQSLHDLLGLDESAILTAARALPMVGQRYSNWAGAAPPFLQAFDHPEPPGAHEFVQYWAKARGEGLRVPFEEFSFGAMAARMGRVPSSADSSDALGATYGYHLDAIAYSMLLREVCIRRGVSVTAGEVASIEASDGRIAAVELGSGERVQADLFVDASGPEALVISKVDGRGRESWSPYLPCDRLLAASAPRLSPPPAFGQVSAFSGGWIGLHPTQDRTGVLAAYSSRVTNEQDVLESLSAVARVPISGDVVLSSVDAGIRIAPWVGNCVAIGDAAVTLEPLDAIPLHLVHMCVSNLISFFPVDREILPEAEEYNAALRRHSENLRDFQCAHYKLNRRFDEPLWDRAREMDVPATLGQKLTMFQARAQIPLYDDETFEANSWASMFLGHGMVPTSYDPRLDSVPSEEHIRIVKARLAAIGSIVPTQPAIEDFISATRIPVGAPASSL